jgi:hypothetical protein
MFERRFAVIADNLKRLNDGRPLLNVIHANCCAQTKLTAN